MFESAEGVSILICCRHCRSDHVFISRAVRVHAGVVGVSVCYFIDGLFSAIGNVDLDWLCPCAVGEGWVDGFRIDYV